MINLTPQDVRLKATAHGKDDAIRQVGELLVANGRIQPDYVDSMLAREGQANTYLGNSIAIDRSYSSPLSALAPIPPLVYSLKLATSEPFTPLVNSPPLRG